MLLLYVGLWLVEIIIFKFVCIEVVSRLIVGVGIGFNRKIFIFVEVRLVVKVCLNI